MLALSIFFEYYLRSKTKSRYGFIRTGFFIGADEHILVKSIFVLAVEKWQALWYNRGSYRPFEKGECMMKKFDFRRMLPKILPSLAIFALPIFAAAMLLRNLGSIISRIVPSDENAKFDFGRIFDQLRDARLALHFALPLTFAVLFFVLIVFVFKGIKSKI